MMKYNIYYEGRKLNSRPLSKKETDEIFSHKYVGINEENNQIRKVLSSKINKVYCIEI